MIGVILCLVLVALLWGGTNPLIKKGSKDIIKIDESSKIKQFLLEIKYLVTNIRYIVPMGLNQLGSVLYFFTLQNAEVSMAVPITNSLTFVFTAITGIILGENKPTRNTILGMLLVLFGTFLCCCDKYVYIVPMGLNQLGSVLYFFTLQNAEVSMAVPITNSLTFVFTAITGIILGENKPTRNTILGMLLVLFGTFLCCCDKYVVSIKDKD